jgi:hypothetical protein
MEHTLKVVTMAMYGPGGAYPDDHPDLPPFFL